MKQTYTDVTLTGQSGQGPVGGAFLSTAVEVRVPRNVGKFVSS
jgi:hypothetical protein